MRRGKQGRRGMRRGNTTRGWRMRATKGYLAGLGTTSALIAAIACAFAILSAVVAVRGWTGALAAPPVPTLEGGGAALSGDPFGALLAGPVARGSTDGAVRRARLDAIAGEGAAGARDVVTRLDAWGDEGAVSGTTQDGEAIGSRSSAGATQLPPQRTPAAGGGVEDGSAPPPAGSDQPPDGGSLGGAVTQVAAGTGAVVTQTGEQLGGGGAGSDRPARRRRRPGEPHGGPGRDADGPGSRRRRERCHRHGRPGGPGNGRHGRRCARRARRVALTPARRGPRRRHAGRAGIITPPWSRSSINSSRTCCRSAAA